MERGGELNLAPTTHTGFHALPSRKENLPIQSANAIRYIPHLDGIRAIAVLVVILYHFEMKFFRGGFVGVDMFFVLSGFLMTRKLRQAVAHDPDFSLLSFYRTRFWRLYPSSIATTLFTVLVALYFFPPGLAIEAVKSGLASTFMSSNALFASQIGGYFDSGSIRKPLLHTWSLSLEEQFYMVWPFLIWATTSKDRAGKDVAFVTTLFALVLGSFFLATKLSRPHMAPHFSWFYLPTRAHEFALGAVTHILDDLWSKSPKALGSRMVSSAISLAGLLCILASVVVLHRDADRRGSFNLPGWHGVPVLLGSMATIITPKSVFSGTAFLSSSMMRFIGRVSYSLYLVHWPVWVFLKWLEVEDNAAFLALVLTFCLGLLLHFSVEQKFRFSSTKWRGTALLQMFLAVLMISGVALCWAPETLSPSGRIADEGCRRPLNASGLPLNPLPLKIWNSKKIDLRNFPWLNWDGPSMLYRTVGNGWETEPPSVVILGDSMASDACEIAANVRQKGWTICLTVSGCYLDFAEIDFEQKRDEPCGPEIALVKKVVERLGRSTKLVVAQDWEGKFMNAKSSRPLEALVGYLLDRQFTDVVVLGDHPRTGKNIHHCLQRQRRDNSLECTDIPLAPSSAQTQKTLREFASKTAAKVVDITPAFCHDGRCAQILCGTPLFDDHMHFSPLGRLIFGHVLIDPINK